MNLKEIGMILPVLLVIVIFGNLWFHFVESILDGIRRIFSKGKKEPAWYPLENSRDEKAETGEGKSRRAAE